MDIHNVAGILAWGECEGCYRFKIIFWITVELLK